MKMNHVDVVFACKGRIWEKERRGVKNGIFSSLVLLFRRGVTQRTAVTT